MFSVIVTTCNREPEVVLRAINSVFCQTYKDVEIVVINDSPSYEKKEELKNEIEKIQGNIFFFENEVSRGANFSRNKGFSLCHGEYVSFLDDDDYWRQDRVEKVMIEFDNGADLVYSDLYIVGKKKTRYSRRKKPQEKDILETLLFDNFLGGFSNVSFKREAFLKCGMLDETFLSYQDQELFIRMVQNNKVCYINEPLSYYCLSNNSISLNPKRKLIGLLSLLEKFSNLYDAFPNSKKKKIESEYVLSVKNNWKENSSTIKNNFLISLDSFCRLEYLTLKGLIKRFLSKFIK